MRKKLNLIIYIFILYFFSQLISYSSTSSVEEVRNSFKEVAYSYYMRGENIQYNARKDFHFTPEEATRQNINYLVCTSFTFVLYQELLNITIPLQPVELLDYGMNNIGQREEAILYSYVNEDNEMIMKIKSLTSENGYKTIKNPTIENIIPLVQVGDILAHRGDTGPGHGFAIYDVIKDNEGRIIDAIVIESGGGKGLTYLNAKISKKEIKDEEGNLFVSSVDTLYLNKKLNSDLEEGVVEGSLTISKLSKYYRWANINNTSIRYKRYTILRFVQEDSKGNAILKFKQELYKYYINNFTDNDVIELSPKNLDRKKYKHLYIEKIVDKQNNGIVEIGEYLSYKIVIKNCWKEDYTDNLIVTENLSKFVIYKYHYENNKIISFDFDSKRNQLKWNIGKLKSSEEFIINYTVRVVKGKLKDIIESTGYVGNINSSPIKNIIGINLNKKQKNLIVQNYEKLKSNFNGKNLINEIYKKSFKVDMTFDKFNISNLINNEILTSLSPNTMNLNTKNSFFDAVLGKYWSTLARIKYAFVEGGEKVSIYNLKSFQFFVGIEKGERREDTIYKETLQTGDILIYVNYDDVTYILDKNNKLTRNYITYEDGEYAYIYIEGKGFVGINYGNDGIPNTKDDRNDFNPKYYIKNNLSIFLSYDGPYDDEYFEKGNLQTLLAKDYYVILRPSLMFNFPKLSNNKINIIIMILLFGIIVLGIGIFISLFYLKMKKNKDSDSSLLKTKLIK